MGWSLVNGKGLTLKYKSPEADPTGETDFEGRVGRQMDHLKINSKCRSSLLPFD